MHAFDGEGSRFMEYLHNRGTFADVPYEELMAAFHLHYPGMMAAIEAGTVREVADTFTRASAASPCTPAGSRTTPARRG